MKWNKRKGPYKWVGIPVKYRKSGLFSRFNRIKVHNRALKAWKKTGFQHHVVLIGPSTALIVNPAWIRAHNSHNFFKKVRLYESLRESVYITPLSTKNPQNGQKRS